MRIFASDESDSTPMVIEVARACYDKDSNTVFLYTADGETFRADDVTLDEAATMMSAMCLQGYYGDRGLQLSML